MRQEADWSVIFYVARVAFFVDNNNFCLVLGRWYLCFVIISLNVFVKYFTPGSPPKINMSLVMSSGPGAFLFFFFFFFGKRWYFGVIWAR